MKIKLIMSLVVSTLLIEPSDSLSHVLSEYELALQYLLKAHQETFPQKPISLDSTSLIVATYEKIIAPHVAYLKGYAHIVQTEQASNRSYHDDLKTLFQAFIEYEKEVKRLANFFPAAQQQAVIDIFHANIGSVVVQTCFNIVQQNSYALTLDPQVLASCYLAYQLVLAIYVPTMIISGVDAGSNVRMMMTSAMATLYQAAIASRQNELSAGLAKADALGSLFQEIEAYYKILSVVYIDAGNGTMSTNMLQKIQATKAQEQSCLQAMSWYAQAHDQAQRARVMVSLDPTNVAAVTKAINAAEQQSLAAYQLLEKAQAAYQAASDPAGQQRCSHELSMIATIDDVVRFLGQLWLLYLTDQSTQNVMTAPAIAALISSTKTDAATVQNGIQALQNLVNFISKPSNNVNQLATETQLQQYSLVAALSVLEQNLLNASIAATNVDSLVNLPTAQQAQIVIGYLQNMLEQILQAASTKNTDSVARAMTYAHAIDTNLTKKNRDMLLSLIPNFPLQLDQNSTWTDWTGIILVQTGAVASKAAAYAQIGKATIQEPDNGDSARTISQLTQQGAALEKAATAAAQAGNFVEATASYQKAFSAYQSLYVAQLGSSGSAEWYQKEMLMRTLFTVSSFVSTVQSQGNVTWKEVTNIPTAYLATEYQFSQISMTDFGAVILPASLQSLAAGSPITTLTQPQQKDLFMLIKAYMVNQLLIAQGINFSDCFVDYTLSVQPSMSPNAESFALQAIDQVQQSVDNFKGSGIVSVTIQDAQTIASINCSNIACSPVVPVYGSMATAATFLQSAYQLCASGSTDIDLGGVSYLPGNDPVIARQVLQKMAYAYLSEAYRHYTKAQSSMKSVRSIAPKGKSLALETLPQNFSDIFSTVNQHVIRAQALLYASGQSAYVYASQSGNQTLTAAIQQIFFSVYQDLISWMTNCLVGDPFSQNYQMLLHQINRAYINWGSMLDPVKDAAQILSFNKNIAELFERAGTMCMQTSYVQSLYPGYQQIHYATAAHYFIAAQKKYESLGQVDLVAKMQHLIRDAYYQGSNQNINLYFHAKTQGVSYRSDETGQLVPITVQQMAQDSLTGFVDGGEQSAYNSVKNLLLNAGMGFEFLANKKMKKTKSTQSPKATTSLAESKNPKKPHVSSKVIAYLQSKKILDATQLAVPYYQPGVIEKIFNLAQDAYKKFAQDEEALESWMNILLLCVQTLYAQDYMGVHGNQSGIAVAQQAQAFFQALQQESSNLENPSSAYVG